MSALTTLCRSRGCSLPLLAAQGHGAGVAGAPAASPEGLEGISRWLATVYGSHPVLYSAGVVLLLLAIGLLLGLLSDLVLSGMGFGTGPTGNDE
jgi:hypothetical protein